MQRVADDASNILSSDETTDSWVGAVSLSPSRSSDSGLRAAQLGAVCAVKAHWTVSREPATVVMPTGTGKTETMMVIVASERLHKALIVVPSNLLRKQTADKFLSFGVLIDIGVINSAAIRPAVGILTTTPTDIAELDALVQKSNVIITTMSLLQHFSLDFLNFLNSNCDALIVDEAHHVAAKTWSSIKQSLKKPLCLQFTATPFRNDGKNVDGKIIYNFPLSMAQKQGYFQTINYIPITEFDDEKSDYAIARACTEQLDKDIANGYKHVILVRARIKNRADYLFHEIYLKYFRKYNPVLVYSGMPATKKAEDLAAVRSGKAKILIGVDMFGEGIDIPNLKIAAVHDKYQSLPITLQFIGRFARSGSDLGTATVVTNIANEELNECLKELYSQDTDWNILLHELSSSAIRSEITLQELASGFVGPGTQEIKITQLRPKISMIAYHTERTEWHWKEWEKVFKEDKCLFFLNETEKILIVIEKEDTHAEWTSFRGISNTNWQLHLLYWNPEIKTVFVNSTNKSITNSFAEHIFPGCMRITGEAVFRCLSGINRLLLGTVGLLSAIDGPIRYRMFAGFDIANGINESNLESNRKCNLFGVGYDGHGRVSIGCSLKGTVWSKWVESVDYWQKWCNTIATKLLDTNIDTSQVLSGALIPQIIKERPQTVPYSIEWPIDLDIISDERICFERAGVTYPLYDFDLYLVSHSDIGAIKFGIKSDKFHEEYELIISSNSYRIITTHVAGIEVHFRHTTRKLVDFFQENPPIIRFVDQSMLEGNVLVTVQSTAPQFKTDKIVPWNWSGIDIHKESQGYARDTDSIQYKVIKELGDSGQFDVIFDDDGKGEIADIVAISDCGDKISFQLFHCKYAHGAQPGARVDDLYEVCCQAGKSVKWRQDINGLIQRMIKREVVYQTANSSSRFIYGDLRKLKELRNKLRVYPMEMSVTVVQPGVLSTAITDDMKRILSLTQAYLMDTYGLPLTLICS